MVDDKVCDHGGDGDEDADNGDDYPGKIHFWKWSWWSLKQIAIGGQPYSTTKENRGSVIHYNL